MTAFVELVAGWQREATGLRRWGATAQAEVLDRCAADVEQALRDQGAELLSLTEAATASGYTPDHLRHLINDGKITNLGRKGAPRLRRGDLPRKLPLPSTSTGPHLLGASRRQIARDVTTSATGNGHA